MDQEETRKSRIKLEPCNSYEIINVTGLSDEELHQRMMQDPGYRKMYESFVREEKMKLRSVKIKRILNERKI